MTSSTLHRTGLSSVQLSFIRAVVLTTGVANILAGVALIFAPDWFYANIGPFAPFNRHYMGDAGTFLLPVGIGQVLSARSPAKHRLIVVVGALVALMHGLNHAYDDVLMYRFQVGQWSGQTWSLLVIAAFSVWAAVLAWRAGRPD